MRVLFSIALLALPSLAAAAPVPPGMVAMTESGAALHLVVTGHRFTARAALENYLAFRAAEATLDHKMQWFSFTERRARGDGALTPLRDPAGPLFSFRMEYFRPQWRWRAAGTAAWRRWSPFSGQPFPDLTGADYELSADIVMHKGRVDDASPLAFDAGAVSDYLVNQVEAPK